MERNENKTFQLIERNLSNMKRRVSAKIKLLSEFAIPIERKRQRFVESRGSSSSSEIRSFPSPRAVKPGVLFLKTADNVPAAINTYARVNTSRLSPRVKQLEGLPLSLPRVSSRASIAPSFFKSSSHLLSTSSSFSTYFFPFYFPLFFHFFFFLSLFLPALCVSPSRTTGTRWRWKRRSRRRRRRRRKRKRERAAGIFPVDIFLVGMRSRYVREALRSKRPRCSYRFHGSLDERSSVPSVRGRGFEIEYRVQRELSRADSNPMR